MTSISSSAITSHQRSGWDRYLDILIRHKIPEKTRRWYVIHAKQFSDAFRSGRLSTITRNDLASYFRSVSSTTKLEDWQFRQMVHAIELLMSDLAHSDALSGFDWVYWKEGAKDLSVSHPTIARTIQHSGSDATSVTQDQGSSSSDQVIEQLVEKIRLRGYAIGTEQTYAQITVRDGKGSKDRVVPLSKRYEETLRLHLEDVRKQHQQDLADGFGTVFLPDALERKYPNALNLKSSVDRYDSL